MYIRQIKPLIIVLLFTIASCATWEGQQYGGRGRTQKPREARQEQGHPVEKEVKRPDGNQFATAGTPERSASMEMVAKGKVHLGSNKYDKALGVFQEAVVVDGTNGIAYYYLAKTRFYLSQFEEALGILDKADALLGTSEEWAEAIQMLRTQIRTSYLSGDEAKESDMIPIINRKDDT